MMVASDMRLYEWELSFRRGGYHWLFWVIQYYILQTVAKQAFIVFTQNNNGKIEEARIESMVRYV